MRMQRTEFVEYIKQNLILHIQGIVIQVAQRATIAHLTASHQNILNRSQVKKFFKLVKGTYLRSPWLDPAEFQTPMRLYSCPCYLQE